MVQKNILATILINNFNNKKFLKKCIYSCLAQSYKNIEIIIYDDKSNDGSKKLLKKIKNNKIKRIFNLKKKYQSSALNQFEAIRKSFFEPNSLIFTLSKPSTNTFMVPSGSFSSCKTFAIVPH